VNILSRRSRKGLKLAILGFCFAQVLILGEVRAVMAQDHGLPPVLTLGDAIKLALGQPSAYKQAQIGESIANEDIKQAKAGFYPKIQAAPKVIYTTPSLAKPTLGTPREPSFLGANAITEYQGLLNAAGEIDTSGKLAATLRRSKALLESARAGSEIAKRELIQTVTEAYFTFALATTKRRGAEVNLQVANEFENNTKLNLDAGEVAPVDLVRARLQTAARTDELFQAQTEEKVAGDTVRFLVGFEFSRAVATVDLLLQMPVDGEIDSCTENAVQTRPEFAQFEADRKAAEEEAKIARTERRPQVSYSVDGGFVSDSLTFPRIRDHVGAQVTFGVTIPLFDWGASKSRETQANLKMEQTDNSRRLAERQFAKDFFSARTQALSAAARIKRIGASIIDAEQNVSASIARYRAGEGPILEVTEAQNTLIAQRQLLYQAVFDYQTARSRLLRAIGQ
jgi:outer membrane protein TolC